MILRGLKFLRSPVMTPASISGMTPSETSSLWTPRSLRSVSRGRTASGIPPIPVCSTAPSSIRAGHVAGDGHVQFGDLGLLHGAQRARGLDDGIDLADVDEAVAIGARHLVVHLGDHEAGSLGSGEGGVDADPEAAEAVSVGRRDLDERHVNGHGAALEKIFDLAEVDGGVVGAAVVDGVAHVAADEHGVVAEMAGHLGRNVGGGAHGQHVDDFDVFDVGPALHQRLDQRLRLGAAGLNVDAHTGGDATQGFVGGAQFLLRIQFARTCLKPQPLASSCQRTTSHLVAAG